MAKLLRSNYLLFVVVQCLVFGFQAYSVRLYDHSFTHECLREPLRPQYGGGMVVNPALDEGLRGWTPFGDATIKHGVSEDGNNFIAASNRNQPYHSISQTFYLDTEKLYTFSAWVRVSHGHADVAAIFKTETGYENVGSAKAQSKCWTMMKGGFVVKTSGLAEFYFETNNTEIDILADSISLQPFTREEWESHQQQNIEKVRKTRVRFQAKDSWDRPIPNATVSLTQSSQSFPLGCAINQNILGNQAYQNWFTQRFTHTVFENELKWYSTEQNPGTVDYSAADNLLQFAQSHGITVRGHNVFWDALADQPYWVMGLSPDALREAANRRINSVMSRYKGKLIHWDVMNENLHNNFFEQRLGDDASTTFYKMANQIDGSATPFLNDYNTIECSGDPQASPQKYLQKIQEMRAQGYNGPLGIGVESHFSNGYPNLPYIRSSLDILASAELPIWVTELDVAEGPNQAQYLRPILQELHSHHAVQGINFWSAMRQDGRCYAMCLTDSNFNNLDTGDVVDYLVDQLKHVADFQSPGTTDSNGVYEIPLYHGEYQVQIRHPNGNDVFSHPQKIKVAPNGGKPDLYHITVNYA